MVTFLIHVGTRRVQVESRLQYGYDARPAVEHQAPGGIQGSHQAMVLWLWLIVVNSGEWFDYG